MSQRIEQNFNTPPVIAEALQPHVGTARQTSTEGVRAGHIPPEAAEIAAPGAARAAARADAPVMNRNLAGAAAPGREGFWSRVGRLFHDLKE